MACVVPDLVEDGRNGLILSGDIHEDAPRLHDALTNTDGLTERLFQGAHESVDIMTWDDVIASHIRLYADILGRTGASDPARDGAQLPAL